MKWGKTEDRLFEKKKNFVRVEIWEKLEWYYMLKKKRLHISDKQKFQDFVKLASFNEERLSTDFSNLQHNKLKLKTEKKNLKSFNATGLINYIYVVIFDVVVIT